MHHPEPARIGAQRTVVSGAPLVLGRVATSAFPSLFEDDIHVSRVHARIDRHPDGVVITDMRSRNGTWVNGLRCDSAQLQPGDIVGVGRSLFLFEYGRLRKSQPHDPALIGISSALMEVLEQTRTVAPHRTTVAIIGETGVGKELIARRIHELSGRGGAIVAVNCSGMSDTLLASDLFGHVRGAFTGAERARRGLIETARGGTLFLDELTDASPGLQASLLRLMETNAYRPVGADQELVADVRYLVAVQPRIRDRLREQSFRLDLWMRLGRWEIEVPPLSRRPEDIALLAAHFARSLLGRPVTIDRELALILLRHPWPGNVRELQGVIERLALDAGNADTLSATPWVIRKLDSERDPAKPPPPRPRRAQRPPPEELAALLTANKGNVRALARELGVDRKTLYRWLVADGIDPSNHRRG